MDPCFGVWDPMFLFLEFWSLGVFGVWGSDGLKFWSFSDTDPLEPNVHMDPFVGVVVGGAGA